MSTLRLDNQLAAQLREIWGAVICPLVQPIFEVFPEDLGVHAAAERANHLVLRVRWCSVPIGRWNIDLELLIIR